MAESVQQTTNTSPVNNAASADSVEQWRGQLFGGQVVAVPGAVDGNGERSWTVTAETGDGVRATTTVQLKGQFTAEHLTPGSEAKESLIAEIENNRGEQTSVLQDLAATAAQPGFVLAAENVSGEGEQWIVDPFNGSVTRFQTGAEIKELSGLAQKLPLPNDIKIREVEATSWPVSLPWNAELGEGRREKGVGLSYEMNNMPLRTSFNVRGGDISLQSLKNGASATITFELTSKQAGEALQQALDKGKGKVSALAPLIDKILNMPAQPKGSIGISYQATAHWNAETQQIEVAIGELGTKFALSELFGELEQLEGEIGQSNYGETALARANNYENYQRGENPYALAEYTRDDAGNYLNHGDPVADIAGRINKIHEFVPMPADANEIPRTNAEAATALERAIEMAGNTPVPPEYLQHVPPAERDGLGPALKPDEREHLGETLALLHEYDIAGLFGEEVAQAAAEYAEDFGDSITVQEDNVGFVRDVFEGEFRDHQPGLLTRMDPVSAVTSVLHWSAAVAWGIVDAGEVTDGTLDNMKASAEGLQARLNEFHGGVLEAVGIAAEEVGDDRDGLQQYALTVLTTQLRAEVGADAHSDALYSAFQEMTQAERENLGERIVAGFENGRMPAQVGQ